MTTFTAFLFLFFSAGAVGAVKPCSWVSPLPENPQSILRFNRSYDNDSYTASTWPSGPDRTFVTMAGEDIASHYQVLEELGRESPPTRPVFHPFRGKPC